jgi:hypothetical protein
MSDIRDLLCLGKIPYNFFLAKEFDDVHYLFTETHQLIWRRIEFCKWPALDFC